MDTPMAEYSQSIRCLPLRPATLTSLPTNHDSGTGQYSVTVKPDIQVPCAFLGGGGGTFWVRPVGASPPPPLGAGAGAPLAARALVGATSASQTPTRVRSRAGDVEPRTCVIALCSAGEREALSPATALAAQGIESA